MEPITIIEGDDLKYLLRYLGMPEEAALDIYRLRFHQTSESTIKCKRNGGTWTPPIGEKDNDA